MPARSSQEGVLPEMWERRRILEQAGTVLAEARSLLESLDQTEGRLNVRRTRSSGLQQRVFIRLLRTKELSEPVRW
jgi:hypothetical protein